MLEAHTHIESESIDVSDPTTTHHALAEIPLSLIDMDFTNTRTKLDTHVIDALAKSIAKNGLINPITLNLKDDGRYSVVAGFTRYSAIQQLQFTHVQARVYEQLTSSQLLEISLSENTVRQDLSITQQLQAMKRVMTELGQIDATTLASRLMWTKSHVNSLLKVSRSPQCVLDALDNGKIELGHATYLVQLLDIGGGDIEQNTKLIEKTIDKIVAEKWSISMLKTKVVAKHIPLALAKFDTKQTCDGCEFNSSTYGSLFDFDNEESLCSKPSCFQQHSNQILQEVKALAEERFGNVIALSALADAQVAPVSEEILGKAQIATCNTCADNIAIINDSVSSKSFTQVKDSLCRNNKCYSKCTKALEQTNATNETVDADEVKTNTDTIAPTVETKTETPVNLGNSTPKQELLSQQAMAQAMMTRINEPEVFQALVGYAIQSLTGARNVSDAIDKNNALKTSNPRDAVHSSYQMLIKYLSTCDKAEGLDCNNPRAILLSLLANDSHKEQLLKDSWVADTQLQTHTIKGIVAICEESGFAEFYGHEAFAKKAKGSKKDLLKAISDKAWDGWADYYPAGHAKSISFRTIEIKSEETNANEAE